MCQIYWMYYHTKMIIVSDNDSFNKKTIDAIIVISTGDSAKTTIADEHINSLRYTSSLSISIPIYLFTDQISCFQSDKFDSYNVHLIEIPDTSQPNNSTQLMLSKSYKTTFFDYLPESLENILYLDIDITATYFFNQRIIPTFDSDEYKQKNCSLLIQKGRPNTEVYSSGNFVAHRYKSKVCLAEWNKKILSGKYIRDQHALRQSKYCMEHICLLPVNMIKWSRNIQTFLPTIPWIFNNNVPLIHYTADTHGTEQSIHTFCKSGLNFQMKLYCILGSFLPQLNLFLIVEQKQDC
eukprot:22470_1